MKSSKKKKMLMIGSIYTICVAILLSVVFLTTGAKYISEINGYTDFNLAEFSGVVLDDITLNNLVKGNNVQSFGAGTIQLADCYPGMPARDYDFVVANGNNTTDCAGVDIEYTIKVQTQRNIPLTYSLLYYYEDDEVKIPTDTDDESSEDLSSEPTPVTSEATTTTAEPTTTTEEPTSTLEPTTTIEGETTLEPESTSPESETTAEPEVEPRICYVFPASRPIQIELDDIHALDDDAPWYSYTFRVSYEELAAKVFTLTGQKLHVMHFALRVEWPIITTENEEDVPTNSSYYMKEIEIINLIVSLNSKDKNQESDYNKDKDDDYGKEHDYHATGVLALTPGLSDGQYTPEDGHGYTVYTYDLDVDYRAFQKQGDETSILYTYHFDVNNGNGIYKFDSAGQRILSQTKKYVQYYLRVMIPYNEDTQDIVITLSDSANKYGILSSEYRKYNIQYDVIKTVMNGDDEVLLNFGEYIVIDEEQADTELGLNAEGEDVEIDESFGYYRVDTFYLIQYVGAEEVPLDDNTPVAYEYFINYNIGEKGYSRFSEKSFTLSVEDNTGDLAELLTEHEDKTQDKEYTFTVIGEAIFSNRPNYWTTTEDAPDENQDDPVIPITSDGESES